MTEDPRHGFAGYCYDRKPGEPYHCLRLPHRTGDHSHWPTRTNWPTTADNPSKPIPAPAPPAG